MLILIDTPPENDEWKRKELLGTMAPRPSRAASALGIVLLTAALATGQAPSEGPFVERSPAASGRIQQYVMDPRGDIQGFVLGDRTHVRISSRAAPDVVHAVKPGMTVRVEGRRHRTVPLVDAESIVDTDTGTRIDVPSRLERAIPPGQVELDVRPMESRGVIEVLLYDTYGRVDGFVLDNGTQVWLPLDANARLRASFATGQPLAAEGFGTANEHGRALEARALGTSPSRVVPLDHAVDDLTAR